MYNLDKIEKIMLDLGGTKEAIAETLKSLNIKGVKKNSRKCPVFNYLMRNISQKEYKEYLYYFKTEHNGKHISDFNPALNEFIYSFDSGEYPELEE